MVSEKLAVKKLEEEENFLQYVLTGRVPLSEEAYNDSCQDVHPH